MNTKNLDNCVLDYLRFHRLERSAKWNCNDFYRKTDDDLFSFDDKSFFANENAIAKYENSLKKTVNIVWYEKFLNSLKTQNQKQKRCDAIVYTDDDLYFTLNELTITSEKNNAKKSFYARLQLKASLKDLNSAPKVCGFIKSHKLKYLCYFNKINAKNPAVRAFNRINALKETLKGYEMPDYEINSQGFCYKEFYGEQKFIMSAIRG
ncbi:MAG: hypothetical protein LBO62_02070 [Endomicrobium sp.]|jgi:hypothetical protein|nr:hypothetical protein [Endomicrobium sp.]